MKKAFTLSLFKEIKSSLAQFFAIFGIVALGVGFFAGLQGTTPDMKLTADAYYDAQKLADFRLKSTMGFTDDDIAALLNEPYISEVEAGYSIDAIIESSGVEKSAAVISLPGDDGPSKPMLTAGRYPENSGECLIDAGALDGEAAFTRLGENLKITADNKQDTLDLFKTKEFKIVGAARSPQYISFQRGNTSLGDGRLGCFVYVEPLAFDSEYYLELRAIIDGALELNSYSDDYADLIDGASDKLRDFADGRESARLKSVKADAQAELDDKKAELKEKEEEYQDALNEYNDKKAEADKELDDANSAIEEGRDELDAAYSEIKGNKNKLNSAIDDYNSQQQNYLDKIGEAQNQLNAGYEELFQKQTEYNAAYAAYEQGAAQLNELNAQIAALEQIGQVEQAAALSAQAQAAAAQLDQTAAYLSSAAAQIDAAAQQLEASRAELESQAAQGRAQLDAALNTINSGEAKLSAAQDEADENAALLDEKEDELEDARAEADRELADAKSELDDANAELSDAKEQIADAQKEIDEIEPPDWYILARTINPGYSGFGSDAERISAISDVFPFFFFLVAALVCLTTMTRMVEEQRTQIGLYKALGYSKGAITGRYVFYALSAGILGSATGLIIGFNVFPAVIWHAYEILYDLPPVILAFDSEAAVISSAAASGCILAAAWAACYLELKTNPAQLMRQKAPAAGKRVFLERFPKIWSKLGFTRKVSVRNLFRYKKRFFMTILGICGCTMLMLTGFGLRDSISHIVSKQYGEIMTYDAAITLTDAGSAHNLELDAELDRTDASYLYISQISASANSKTKSIDVYIAVPEDAEKLADFTEFKDRETGDKIAFPGSGAVISEKLSNELNAPAGGILNITQGDDINADAQVSAVTENYIFHYVYLTNNGYREIFGKEPQYGQVYVNVPGITDDAAREAFSEKLLKIDGVAAVTFADKIASDFEDIMKSLDAVVWVLLFCACLLAFIVLYNLANINITERKREIATLKVLGFYDREVSAYTFRENIILTLIGMAAGLFFGIFLHRFVVVTAEVDIVMFERSIAPVSFVYAGALTVLFAYAVNGIMHFRLKKIDMIESLKSTE